MSKVNLELSAFVTGSMEFDIPDDMTADVIGKMTQAPALSIKPVFINLPEEYGKEDQNVMMLQALKQVLDALAARCQSESDKQGIRTSVEKTEPPTGGLVQ